MQFSIWKICTRNFIIHIFSMKATDIFFIMRVPPQIILWAHVSQRHICALKFGTRSSPFDNQYSAVVRQLCMQST